MALFKDKVWLSLTEKGKKINHEAQLEQMKLLIELNSQEIATYTNYFIAFLTVSISVMISLPSLKLPIEYTVIFIFVIAAMAIIMGKKISGIHKNNEILQPIPLG